MILKNILLKNFRCYYGENRFDFSKWLTLIIGDNGDGKTTFFDSLEWLFDTANFNNTPASNISEKRKEELANNEEDEVKVTLIFDHNGEIELEKSFKFYKSDDGSLRTSDYKFIGYQSINSERIPKRGKQLLEECFDTALRRYCMFKGESELNVFDNNEALKTLVNTFSNIRQFEDYVKLTEQFESDSQKIELKELSKDKKQEKLIKDLETQKIQNTTQIQDIKQEISKKEQAVIDYSQNLEKIEQNQEACEAYQDIKKRIEAKKAKQRELKDLVSVDYNTNLLDKYWIMRSYPAILKEFQDKVSGLSKEKRRLDKEETERRAIEKGKKELASDLLNGITPLPWDVPNPETMQEMIDEEVCKVCGRPAPKGSDAYNFMVAKLNAYTEQIKKKAQAEENEKPFFPNNYIDELNKLSNQLSGYRQKEIVEKKAEINDELAFIVSRKRELEQVEADIEEAEKEKSRLIMQTQAGMSEDMLDKGFKDFKGLSEMRNRAEVKLTELKRDLGDLQKEKQRIDDELSKIEPSNGTANLYKKVHTAFRFIMNSFVNAKERNINEFLELLESKTNDYFTKLNKNDFHGQIRIIKCANGSAKIQLYSSNGSLITNPGGAQKTTMYMSVLFAISNITTLKREQDYPLIFDAPTSSFGELKEYVFYNIIDHIDKQCIIVTKDLLEIDSAIGAKRLNAEKINRLECKVYQISKADGYNPLDLSTIQTIVKPIK
jgi:DNA sulfur modification protein DndD